MCDTLVNIPHDALGQEVTTRADDRKILFLIAKIFEGFGMVLAAVLPAVLMQVFHQHCYNSCLF